MTPDEYVKLAVRTEAPITTAVQQRLQNSTRDVHGFMGIVTEVGELIDAYKKYIFYGKEQDITNVAEEIGDMMWYIALLCDELDVSLEDIMIANIAKLRARYPDKFTEDKAINRDLATERKVLEDAQMKLVLTETSGTVVDFEGKKEALLRMAKKIGCHYAKVILIGPQGEYVLIDRTGGQSGE